MRLERLEKQIDEYTVIQHVKYHIPSQRLKHQLNRK